MSVEMAAGSVRQPNLLISTWRIAAPFWRNRKGLWLQCLLLALAITLTFAQTSANLSMVKWTGEWMATLQSRDQSHIGSLVTRFLIIAALMVTLPALARLFSALLGINWRTDMTHRLVKGWAGSKALVWIEQRRILDNPDQRISEDTQLFTTSILSLMLSVILSVFSMINYSMLIWTLGSTLPLAIGGWSITVPGGLYWAAIVWAVLFSILTHLVGRTLLRLVIEQQQKEANFRFKAATIREYAEQVSLMGGEQAEVRALRTRFREVRSVLIRVALLNVRLTPTIAYLAMLTQYVFTFLLLGSYFGNRIGMSELFQISGAISSLSVALALVPQCYVELQTLRAVVTRLGELDSAITLATDVQGPTRVATASGDMRVRDLNLATPAGRPLTQNISFRVASGERWMVRGPSGIGKSTLLRAIAGIWSHGSGSIDLPEGKVMMLPQKVYIPEGTLKAALCYPDEAAQADDSRCREALVQVNLAGFADQLEQSAPWQHRMSPGEQQRLNFARVLLQRPDFLLLDEASSALDEANETRMFAILRENLPGLTLISVTHNEKLAGEHDQQLDLSRFTTPEENPPS